MLYSARAWGDEKLALVCLWDGKSGDCLGGMRGLVESAQIRTGRVYCLNQLNYLGLEQKRDRRIYVPLASGATACCDWSFHCATHALFSRASVSSQR